MGPTIPVAAMVQRQANPPVFREIPAHKSVSERVVSWLPWRGLPERPGNSGEFGECSMVARVRDTPTRAYLL